MTYDKEVIRIVFKRASRKQAVAIGAIMAVIALAACLLALNIPRTYEADAPSEALLKASNGLDRIIIEATFLPDKNQLSATQTMHLQSKGTEELVLRTYANAFLTEDTSPAAIEVLHEQCYYDGFSSGGIAIEKITVDGVQTPVTYEDGAKTVLVIPTPANADVVVTLDYVITIPKCSYRFGVSGGIYQLGNAFPILAAYEDGAYLKEDYYPIGDPFVSDCANYEVHITVPEGYTAQGTGMPQKNGQTFSFDALAVREFALTLSNAYQVRMAKADGVVILSYALTAQKAQKALDTVKEALIIFNEALGKYPYPSLTVCEINFPFGGMEYPQMMMLSSALYENNDDTLEWAAAHETAHQWFYAVVGSDQYDEPWQDEALCEYMVFHYIGKRHGENARQDAIFRKAETSMRVTVPRGVTPGSPIENFGDLNEYSLVVYNRGSALMVALETALGKDEMMAFLRAYYEQFAFRTATRQDFEQTLLNITGRDYLELIKDYLDTHIIN